MKEHDGYQFIVADSPDHFHAAAELFKEYAATLDFDLCFQGFDQELREIEIQYDLPVGGLILIRKDGEFIGCAGIRKFEAKIGELKRMYIRPAHRGAGMGKLLLETAIELAKDLGYNAVRLDTLKSMTRAISIYRQFEFKDIEAYRFNPSADVLYLEKQIR